MLEVPKAQYSVRMMRSMYRIQKYLRLVLA